MIFWGLLLILLITRFFGLDWGAPYFFHPDENNIATALLNLSCPDLTDLKNCFEPGFYAYGQLYLYLGKLLMVFINQPNLSLRILSSVSSVLTGIVFYFLIRRDFKSKKAALIGLLVFCFTPIFIQLSHFGTTESFSILLFTLALYYRQSFLILGFLIGLLAATKVSNFILLVMPFFSFYFYWHKIRPLISSILIAVLVFIIFSPHYFLNFPLFYKSMQYEIAVATGVLPVFYTQQFVGTTPILFQIVKILPYAVGPLLMVLSFVGLLSQIKDRKYYLPLLFLLLFLHSGFTFAKWTRFLALTYILIVYFGVYGLALIAKRMRGRQLLLWVILLIQVVSGLLFFRLYFSSDTRILANQWIEKNIKPETMVITEAANVVDLPFDRSRYQVSSFFLYDLDKNEELKKIVFTKLNQAEYVIVPSRRVFANYTCFEFAKNEVKRKDNCDLDKAYPQINRYYQTLFLSKKFRLVKTFAFRNDEKAEETFTVFDHPTVRIYKRIN